MRHREDDPEERSLGDTESYGCTTSGDDLLAIGLALRAAVGEHLLRRERRPDSVFLQIARHQGGANALREYARREQACCSFFDVTVSEDAEMLSVTVSGPPQAAALLDLLYQLAEPAGAAS